MLSYNVCFIFAIQLISPVISAWNDNEMYFTNVTIVNDDNYINFNVTLNPDGKTFSYQTNVLQKFSQFNVGVHISYKSVMPPTPSQIFFEKTLDYCEYIKKKPLPDVLMRIAIEEFRKNSIDGFMVRCPVEVGSYRVLNFGVDISKLVPVMPRVTFRITLRVNLKENSKSIYTMIIDGISDSKQEWTNYQQALAKKD